MGNYDERKRACEVSDPDIEKIVEQAVDEVTFQIKEANHE